MSDSPIQSGKPQKPAKKVKLLPMGILAVVASALQFVGMPVVGWVGLAVGIGAVVEGYKAKKADPNSSEAKAAFVLGIIALVLFAAGMILSFVYVGMLMGSGELS